MNNQKSIALILIMVISTLLIATPLQTQSAKFVLASWSYPDEYGQGINAFDIFENSTGAWLYAVTGYGPSDSYAMEWNYSIAIKLRCYTSFNQTLTGVGSLAEGKNYQRHNVTVTAFNGTIVFSQQNFTYYSSGEYASLYWYNYDVILNFLPVGGEVYTVTITYEIYW